MMIRIFSFFIIFFPCIAVITGMILPSLQQQQQQHRKRLFDNSKISSSTRLNFYPNQQSSSTNMPYPNKAFSSSLFRRRTRITRKMVLTTPESIIEQASTQKLLDDLIDESVRMVARKPIMLQFDPSSSFVSTTCSFPTTFILLHSSPPTMYSFDVTRFGDDGLEQCLVKHGYLA
jgi:hypothetical protein